MWDLQ
jgi:molybdopterin-binding protein